VEERSAPTGPISRDIDAGEFHAWTRRPSDGRLVVNVGAIGRPANDGQPHVWYALLDLSEEEPDATFLPLSYDHDRLAAGMRAEGIVEPFVTTVETGWWTTCLEILPTKVRARGKYGPVPLRRSLSSPHSPFRFLMILGMKNEKTKRATEKITLKERRPPQFPLAQTSRTVPTKKVKMKVPTMIPRPVPKT